MRVSRQWCCGHPVALSDDGGGWPEGLGFSVGMDACEVESEDDQESKMEVKLKVKMRSRR